MKKYYPTVEDFSNWYCNYMKVKSEDQLLMGPLDSYEMRYYVCEICSVRGKDSETEVLGRDPKLLLIEKYIPARDVYVKVKYFTTKLGAQGVVEMIEHSADALARKIGTGAFIITPHMKDRYVAEFTNRNLTVSNYYKPIEADYYLIPDRWLFTHNDNTLSTDQKSTSCDFDMLRKKLRGDMIPWDTRSDMVYHAGSDTTSIRVDNIRSKVGKELSKYDNVVKMQHSAGRYQLESYDKNKFKAMNGVIQRDTVKMEYSVGAYEIMNYKFVLDLPGSNEFTVRFMESTLCGNIIIKLSAQTITLTSDDILNYERVYEIHKETNYTSWYLNQFKAFDYSTETIPDDNTSASYFLIKYRSFKFTNDYKREALGEDYIDIANAIDSAKYPEILKGIHNKYNDILNLDRRDRNNARAYAKISKAVSWCKTFGSIEEYPEIRPQRIDEQRKARIRMYDRGNNSRKRINDFEVKSACEKVLRLHAYLKANTRVCDRVLSNMNSHLEQVDNSYIQKAFANFISQENCVGSWNIEDMSVDQLQGVTLYWLLRENRKKSITLLKTTTVSDLISGTKLSRTYNAFGRKKIFDAKFEQEEHKCFLYITYSEMIARFRNSVQYNELHIL